jgi:uncharacterized protein YcbX
MATVARLTYYPVKGCAGASPAEAVVTPAGLAHDRSYMVVDPNGLGRTQRRDPRLALVRPAVDGDGAAMVLEGPDVEPVRFAVDTDGERRAVRLFDHDLTGIDQGDAAAEWFSEVLGKPSRLVRVPPEHARLSDGLTAGPSGYADSCALHVVSQASMDGLNARLAARGEPPLPADRFRANVLIEGWGEPHREDSARRITIGTARFGFSKLVVRCAVTLVDQAAGRRAGPEPVRTLSEYRRLSGPGTLFGVNFAVVVIGTVAVGDKVVVEEWAEGD